MLSPGAWRPHPLHAVLLAFPVALFPSGLIADIAYLRTAQIQWTNFAAWLITGALVFGGLVGVWALVDLFRAFRRGAAGRVAAYVTALALAWVLGLVNAFQHSGDGWASVGTTGLVLSVLCSLLVVIAALIAHSGREIAR